MNDRMMVSCVFAVIVAAAAARGATEEWTYGGLSGVVQLVADGSGGCAFTRRTGGSGNKGEVVWLDQAGQVRYQAGLSNLVHGGGIMMSTPTDLVYGDLWATKLVIHVNAKGEAAIVPAAANTVNASPAFFPLYHQRMDDKKGFFAVRMNTNTAAATVVRYSYK